MLTSLVYEDKNFQNTVTVSLTDAEFENCVFENIDFQEIPFTNSRFLDCEFINCNLSNLGLKGVSLRDTKFKECKMIGINWCRSTSLFSLNFFDSKMDFNVFQGLELRNYILKNCSLKESDFSQSDLTKTMFNGSDLSGSFFSGANLDQTDLRDSINYQINLNYVKANKIKLSANQALSLLTELGHRVYSS